MKKILFSVLPIVSLVMLALKPIGELPIGADMPKGDVKMKDISGKEITLKDAVRKNGLLVMFSCNTCPVVIKNQARTLEISNYAHGKEIGVILINSNEAQRDNEDSFKAMKEYAKDQGFDFHYAVDNNSVLADAFGANRTPECFLFNKDNKLVYHGAIDDNPTNPGGVNRRHLKEAIDEMRAGKDITVKESRSVGCSIKRKN